MDVARTVDGFQGEVEALRNRWRDIRGLGGAGTSKAEKTAMWEFYRPILKALVTLGGTAKLHEILPVARAELDGVLKPGDLELMANGRPRWEVTIRRSRKYMTKEGFIEASTGLKWQITGPGKRAAASGISRKR